MRQFRDGNGTEWEVFLMTRGAHSVAREQHLPEHFREGWLVFQSGAEKRRFAPPPANWESLSNDELVELLALAIPQTLGAKRREELVEHRRRAAVESVASSPSGDPLRPELEELQHRLETTLVEVCEMPSASKLDTGELIRVEETLAIAAEAAKEAISLRRRLRSDREKNTSDSALGGSSSEHHPGDA